MKNNKLIALLITSVMLLALAGAPASAAESNAPATVPFVIDNFEDGDLSDWGFRNTYHGSVQGATVAEENGNKFLRVSLNGDYRPGYDGAKAATYSKKFSEGIFAMDMSNYSVLEIKVRTNQKTTRKYIKFNYPLTNQPANNWYNDLGQNTRALWLVHNNGNMSYFRAHSSVNGYAGDGSDLLQYDANEWYTLRIVYDNVNKKADFVIFNSNGEPIATAFDKELVAWWFTHDDHTKASPNEFDTIEDITIQFRHDGGGNVSNEYFDIDDLKIYNQKPIVNTELDWGTDKEYIYKPQKLYVKFDAPVNYTNGGIKLYTSGGEEIPHSGSYDEKSFTYTASFDTYLPQGNYKFDISGITPANMVGALKIPSMSFDRTEIPFECFEVNPPQVENVSISGRVICGNVITADYDFQSEDSEGASEYKWYVANSADAADNEWSLIENATFKELEVTEDTEGKYVRFEVLPVSISGLRGSAKKSNIISPEQAPVASEVKLSSTLAYVGANISATYIFSDANGDEEGDTVITWYTADSLDGEWTEVGTGKYYAVTEGDYGKYLKFIVSPVAVSQVLSAGVAVESDVSGVISTLSEATNLFTNPGFEDGVLGDWEIRNNTSGYQGIEIAEEDAFEGNYALRLYPRLNATTDVWAQSVELTAGSRYILSGMARKLNEAASDVSKFEGYCWTEGVTRPYRDEEYTSVLSASDWTRVSLSMDVTETKEYSLSFLSYYTIAHELVMDNMYVGPLLIDDIKTNTIDPITIPQTGNVEVKITDGEVLNQFGEKDGLLAETVVLSTDAQGVSVSGNKVIISPFAVAGTIDVEVSCTPSYATEFQDKYSKTVQIELLPGTDSKPQARNVIASGVVSENSVLTGSYAFYQVDGKVDASEIQWMYSDTLNGKYYPIVGATSETYTVESQYVDKFIAFAVTPKTTDGLVGAVTYSNVLTRPTAPVASELAVSGSWGVGDKIKVSYKYSDINSDSEGSTIIKWYASESANGSYDVIGTGEELVLTESLVDKYIKVGITPVASVYPENGTEAFSDIFRGPVAPIASNVQIVKNGNVLEGLYTYSHAHNATEKGTQYKWTVDGVVVSNTSDYVISFTGSKNVVFTVIPCTDVKPGTGKAVSVSVVVSGLPSTSGGNAVVGGFAGGGAGGSSGGGGSSSGGSSGGSGANFSGGVLNVNDMTLTPQMPEEEEPVVPVSDVDGHWGSDYIKDMEKRGVMSADADGNYQPDENATRQQMLTYLFKALKLDTTEYKNEFSDVEAGEFADMLQTMVDNGTISKDDSFRPDDTISREEMCKILYVSLKNAGKLEDTEEMLIESFSDYESISEWARPYVNGIYAAGIMIGVSDTEFDSQGTVTKAQAATMLVRILALTEKEAE